MSYRRNRKNGKALKLVALAILAMAVLSGLALCSNGSQAPAPLHDRITPAPAPAPTPAAYGERESHYLAHLKARGMDNNAVSATDYEMIAVGRMICTDFRSDDSATYATERPRVQAYTDGDPVYASLYMDAATDILCAGEVDK